MSQLGLGLGLTKGGVVPFNPLSLNPYLLFDTQSSMIGTFENPTLDLDPSQPDTLNVITATRAGVATYTDAAGLIQSADPDTVRVDYTQGEELTPTKFQRVGYTDFSQGWNGQAGVTSEAGDEYENQPVRRVIYDGVTTGGIYQTIVNTVGSVSYTGSFYARRISGSNQIYIRHGFSASGNQTILPVTTEWQKFSVTILGASGGGNVYFGLIQFSAGDDVYEITQPQFEEGTTASDFVENTTGSPKFITGATYADRVPMILVEPSATNLLPYSEDFSHAGWTKYNDVAVTSSSVNSPDGTTNAFKITGLESTDGDVGLTERVGASASTTYTFSAYFKALGNDDVGKKIRIRLKRNGGALVSSNQQVVLSSEWVRHSVTITLLSDNTGVDITISKDGSSPIAERTDECLIYGAQLEEGSVPTSYIPTSGGDAAARTRAADDLVISGSDFSDFYNQSEGTVYVESTGRGYFDFNTMFAFSDNSVFNRIYARSTSNTGGLAVFSGGSTSASMGGFAIVADNVLSRYASSFKVNDFLTSRDGISATPDTSGNMPVGIDRLYIGAGDTGGNHLNGHIKRLIYWPYHSDSL